MMIFWGECVLNKKDLQIEFNTEILWVQRFFKRSVTDARYSQIEQMIIDRKEELRYPYIKKDLNSGFKTNKKDTPLALKIIEIEEADNLLKIYQTWQQVLNQHISHTDKATLNVIRAVFVNKSMNVSKAGAKYLHYGQTTTYKIIYKWFQDLNFAFFNAR